MARVESLAAHSSKGVGNVVFIKFSCAAEGAHTEWENLSRHLWLL